MRYEDSCLVIPGYVAGECPACENAMFDDEGEGDDGDAIEIQVRSS